MPITDSGWVLIKQSACEAVDRDLYFAGIICLLRERDQPTDTQLRFAIKQALAVDALRHPGEAASRRDVNNTGVYQSRR
jgi:hypothetical protein